MTSALTAAGTTFSWNGTALAELTKISYSGRKVDLVDVSNHDSTSQVREFLASFVDGGEVTIEGNFIPGDTAGQIAFDTDAAARTTREWIITSPSAGAFTLTADGVVSAGPSLDFAFDGKISFSATIKVSGVVTLGITYEDQLSGLSLTTATLLPTFAAGTYAYTATTTGASVTVTPTCAGADSITVNGTVVASGAASGAISAGAIGTNTAIQIRCIGTGKMDRVYNVTLVKTA